MKPTLIPEQPNTLHITLMIDYHVTRRFARLIESFLCKKLDDSMKNKIFLNYYQRNL